MLHVPQSTSALPLLRTRFILLLLSLIFLIASESASVATFAKHKSIQHLINSSVQTGVTVELGYHDVMITIVVFFIAAQLLTTLVSNIVIVHLQNVYNILPPRIAKKLGLANTQLASSTLGYQALAFAVLLIFNVISLAFFTVYTFTRGHTIEVEATENLNLPADFGPTLIGQLGIAVAYRDAGYITLGVELSWIALFLSALTMLATGIAWHKRRAPTPSLASTQIELGKGEAVVEVMAAIEDKDPRSH
ncbi:hypothetical protein PTI98_012814 [Pleurotus ostreatus]|nr:hypothetical protein PTI98_012814 [Pleurotus ostreatus]